MTGSSVRLVDRHEAGRAWPCLVARWSLGTRAVASTVVGGGLGACAWWFNTTVDRDYHHPDPAEHVRAMATELGLHGRGVGMITAADTTRRVMASDSGVEVVATVGLGLPVYAAASPAAIVAETAAPVGTINVLATLPVPMSDAALVNAVVTLTEAKTQALMDAGVPGTGTSSDAVCIASPPPGLGDGGGEPYGGPRSPWGAALARAVHEAVLTGTQEWMERHGRWG